MDEQEMETPPGLPPIQGYTPEWLQAKLAELQEAMRFIQAHSQYQEQLKKDAEKVLEAIITRDVQEPLRESYKDTEFTYVPRVADIAKFSGKKNSKDVKVYLENVNIIFMLAGSKISDSQKVYYTLATLGPALQWWTNTGEGIWKRKCEANPEMSGFHVLQTVIEDEFCDRHQEQKSRNALQAMTQGKFSVSNLFDMFNKHLGYIPDTFSDATKKHWIRSALNPAILNAMNTTVWDNDATIDDVHKAALQAERNLITNYRRYMPNGYYNVDQPMPRHYNQEPMPRHYNQEPMPMDLGRHQLNYGRGRGSDRGRHGRGGRGHGFGRGGFGRGNPHLQQIQQYQQRQQHHHQQQPPQLQQQQQRGFGCHECGSHDHFVKNCPIRQKKQRQRMQELRRIQQIEYNKQQAASVQEYENLFIQDENGDPVPKN
jgi:hypothetical protein